MQSNDLEQIHLPAIEGKYWSSNSIRERVILQLRATLLYETRQLHKSTPTCIQDILTWAIQYITDLNDSSNAYFILGLMSFIKQ